MDCRKLSSLAHNGLKAACALVSLALLCVTLASAQSSVFPPSTSGGAAAPLYSTDSASTNQSITSTTMVTAPANGKYLVAFYIQQVDQGTSCTGVAGASLSIGYTDQGGTAWSSVALPVWQLGAPATTIKFSSNISFSYTGSLVAYGTYTLLINLGSGQSLTYAVSYTAGSGCTTSQHYIVHPVVYSGNANGQ